MATPDYVRKVINHQQTANWIDEARTMLSLVRVSADSLLDFGCGPGGLTTMVRSTLKYTGYDVSSAMVKAASRTYERHRFVSTLPDEQFDAVVSVHVLPHIEHPVADFILPIRRSLKLQGQLVVSVCPPWHSRCWWLANLFNGYKTDPTIAHTYDEKSLCALLQAYGFEVGHVMYSGAKPMGWPWLPEWTRRVLIVSARRVF